MTTEEFFNLKCGDIIINNNTLYKITNIINTKYNNGNKLCEIKPLKESINTWDRFDEYTKQFFDLPTDLEKVKFL